MPNDYEDVSGLEIRFGYRADRSISIDERIPDGKQLSAEGNLRPQKDRQVVRQVAGTAVVEVEECRFNWGKARKS
jgi:hypothetical protein